MAEPHVHVPCVPREIFYKQLDALKNKQAKKESQITLFIEDSFFDKAKAYLNLIPDRDTAWNSIRRTRAVEVGKINSHKKATGGLIQTTQ